MRSFRQRFDFQRGFITTHSGDDQDSRVRSDQPPASVSARSRPNPVRTAGRGTRCPLVLPPGPTARPSPALYSGLPPCTPRYWRARPPRPAAPARTNTARAAPRDNASDPSRRCRRTHPCTEAPSIRERPAQCACIRMSKRAWRTRSAVGLVSNPGGAINVRPRQAPATIRIQARRLRGASVASGFGNCSRSTRFGSLSMPPRGKVPNWNGP